MSSVNTVTFDKVELELCVISWWQKLRLIPVILFSFSTISLIWLKLLGGFVICSSNYQNKILWLIDTNINLDLVNIRISYRLVIPAGQRDCPCLLPRLPTCCWNIIFCSTNFCENKRLCCRRTFLSSEPWIRRSSLLASPSRSVLWRTLFLW